ncbi:MAG TPA: NTP transferase domain-containing protein, partial [Thermoanaerobaculia bacterium]|nr:NTP transferase domain-containing protein [Thermoanaerobaculia bacterium]
ERVTSAASLAFSRVIAVEREGGEGWSGGETIFEPARPERAPIFGLRRALDHSSAKFWLLAADMPLIPGSLLAWLRSEFERAPSAEMLVPIWNGRPQMLCAGYSAGLKSRVDERIGSGDFRMRSLMTLAAVVMVPEEELRSRWKGEPLMNVNTPEELEQARRIDGDEKAADPSRQ